VIAFTEAGGGAWTVAEGAVGLDLLLSSPGGTNHKPDRLNGRYSASGLATSSLPDGDRGGVSFFIGPVAQLVVRRPVKPQVAGSSPARSSIASVAERLSHLPVEQAPQRASQVRVLPDAPSSFSGAGVSSAPLSRCQTHVAAALSGMPCGLAESAGRAPSGGAGSGATRDTGRGDFLTRSPARHWVARGSERRVARPRTSACPGGHPYTRGRAAQFPDSPSSPWSPRLHRGGMGRAVSILFSAVTR